MEGKNMKEDFDKKRLKDVDSGWAWVSLMACFFGNSLVGFATYSAGMFHVALLKEFKQGNASTSLVGSIFTSMLCVFGPFVGMLINATSCRGAMMFGGVLLFLGYSMAYFAKNITTMIITYGFIAGVGSGFACVSPVVMVGYSFKKYLGIATGIVGAAGGCGMFAAGPLVQFFLDTYGLHGAFLLMGAVTSHCIVAGALMRPSGPELYQNEERKLSKGKHEGKCGNIRNIFDANILKNKSFLMIFLATLLWNSAYVIVLLHLPNFSVTKGYDTFQASFLILEIGIGSIVSRILSGLAAGSGLDPLLLNMGVLGVTGILTLLFPFYSTYFWQQSLFAILFGFYSGGLIAFMVPICLEIVGISGLASAMGLMYFAAGIGYMTGPPLVGFMVDKTGIYENGFYYAGACLTTGSFLVLLSTLWRPKEVDRTHEDIEIVLKRSNVLAGSGFLTGSLHILYEAQQCSTSELSKSLSQVINMRNIDADDNVSESAPFRCVHDNS